MKICIITGSNGLVGSSSVNFFLRKKFRVIGIDNNLREYFFGKDGSTSWLKKINKKKDNFLHKNVDIRNYKELKKIFRQNKNNIKLVIHTAAQPSHDWAAKEPLTDFTVNANGTLNLLECTRVFSPKAKFIFTSTNKVYGDNPNKLKLFSKKTRLELSRTNKYFKGINEKMSVDNCIHSLFGVSKSSSDFLVQEYGKNLGLNTIIFRAGCITGANHSSAEYHGFLSYLVKKTLKDKSYKVIGYKGLQVRDNLHSNDLVKCFWHYYKKPKKKGEVYNIGGSRYSNCSVEEALKIVENIKKIKIKRNYITKSRVGDHKWWISDISKFTKDYPKFRLTYNTEKIITELIEFYSQNK
jgi:CDP-paratose 2-epimerase